jgi:hypothetical protein
LDVPSLAFLLLFLGLMRAFWKEAMSLAPAAEPKQQLPVKKKASGRRR